MLRAQVLRRNFSLFTRVPYSRIVRSAARDGHDSVIIQRVRIHKPFFSKSRIVGAVTVATAFHAVTRYVSIEVEVETIEEGGQKTPREGGQISNGDEADQDEGDDDDEEDDAEDEYDDAILFLPTGFSRPKPRTFYKGSDPEWQEFKKVAADRPRVEKIRNELSVMIRGLAKKNPSYVARLGNIDAGKGKAWIEVRFPDGPPIEYERPGLELTEDLEWRKATRPVEDFHHQRLTNLLFPTNVSNALYQDTKRKAQVSWKSFRAYMGWQDKAEPETVQGVVQRVVTPTPPSTPESAATPAASSPAASAATESKPSTQDASPLGSPAKDVGFALPDPKKLTLDLSQFRQDFRKAFKPYALQAPRGTFMVMGLIEVYGDRARMTLNVTAAYDPKQGRYVNLKAAVWNLVDHRQNPKGGP